MKDEGAGGGRANVTNFTKWWHLSSDNGAGGRRRVGALSEDNRNAKFAARPSVKSQFFSRLINRVSKSRISRPANQHKPPSNFFPNAVKGKYAYRMKTHRTWSSSQRIAGRKAGKLGACYTPASDLTYELNNYPDAREKHRRRGAAVWVEARE